MATATKTAKVPNYTEAQADELRDAWMKNPVEETKNAYAVKFGKSVRSITAKLSRMGIYVKPERTRKDGTPVEKKNETVTAIGAVLALSPEEADSLTKATRSTLQKIWKALATSKPIEGADELSQPAAFMGDEEDQA